MTIPKFLKTAALAALALTFCADIAEARCGKKGRVYSYSGGGGGMGRGHRGGRGGGGSAPAYAAQPAPYAPEYAAQPTGYAPTYATQQTSYAPAAAPAYGAPQSAGMAPASGDFGPPPPPMPR